jgi:pimeloyl-ACP methyl ester carboxylesterase
MTVGLCIVATLDVLGGCQSWNSPAAASAERRPEKTVSDHSYVPIGGIEQWIEIQGADSRNPVILVLHGGPGSTWDPLVGLFAQWEQHFTMVYWSQRGAGKTYRKTGDAIANTMTIDRMVSDGIEVAQYLRGRLGKQRIILLGHSWGTVLGVRMAQSRPDLFSAYVGTGQFVNGTDDERAGYLEVLRRAEVAGRSDAVTELRALGLPPYDDINKMVTERRWAGVFDTPSDAAFNVRWRNPPEFSAADAKERYQAWLFSNLLMFGALLQDGPLMQIDFASTALRFRIPMIFIQGEDDIITPTSIVAEYERRLSAPKKALIRLPEGGHNAVFTMPEVFLQEMTRELRGVPVL